MTTAISSRNIIMFVTLTRNNSKMEVQDVSIFVGDRRHADTHKSAQRKNRLILFIKITTLIVNACKLHLHYDCPRFFAWLGKD